MAGETESLVPNPAAAPAPPVPEAPRPTGSEINGLSFSDAINAMRRSRTSAPLGTTETETAKGASPEVARGEPVSEPETPATDPEKAPAAEAEAGSDPIVFTDEDGTTYTKSQIKEGILRRADYTKKTQELAAERKVVDEYKQRRDEFLQALTTAQEQEKAAAPSPPDPVLRFTDPQKYAVQTADYLLYQQRQEQRAKEIERLSQEKAGEFASAYETKVREEAALMYEKVPALRTAETPEKRKEILDRYKATAKAVGFTDAELKGLADHRFALLLDWATRGKAVKDGGDKGREVQTQQRTTTPTPTIRNASGTTPTVSSAEAAVQAAQAKFEKSKSMEDARALMRAKRLAAQA